MRLLRVIALALLLLPVLPAGTLAGVSPDDRLIQELSSQEQAAPRRGRAARSAYGTAVRVLVTRMGRGKPEERANAERALQEICFRASRPGAEAERAAASQALLAWLGPQTPESARLGVLKQLQHIGRKEAVDALVRLLGDRIRLVRAAALRALQANPAPEAGARLRKLLVSARTSAWRVAFANALGFRRDRQAVPLLAPLAVASDPAVAEAAVSALGAIGGAEAAAALAPALARRLTAPPELRRAVEDAVLLCADSLVAAGSRDEGARLYEQMLAPKEPRRVRIAALRGLALARGAAAVPQVLAALKSDDARVQAAAAHLATEIQGPNVTQLFVAELPRLKPEAQALLIRALDDRGDVAAGPAVMAAVQSEDEDVRVAALEALARLGDAASVRVLATAAAGGTNREKDAARFSLSRLRGQGMDAAIIAAMEGAPPAVRIELVRSLPARRAVGTTPELLAVVARDDDEAVRLAALNAFADLADGRQLPSLVQHLVAAQSDREREAAERAVAAICRKIPDDQADLRAAPILAAQATGPARLALLRLLGHTGSDAALEALRATITQADAAERDAAIRGLCQWPDARPAADLLELVRTSTNPDHRRLGLQAYIRVLGAPSSRPPAETARLMLEALVLAQAPDEKKWVLAGLAKVPAIEALRATQARLRDPEVTTDAADATVKVAGLVSGVFRDEAMAALKEVLETTKDERVRGQANAAIERITRFEDYFTDWLVAGPYTEPAKDSNLFDTAFPPETNAAEVRWFRAPMSSNPDRAWEVDLNATDMRGDNRAAYLRTRIWSPKKQEAQLELGSDDGVKVWLNGVLVHSNNVARPTTPGEDKVKVTLNEGWNALLVKVVNGGADWSACVRVRSPEGGKLEGVRAQAE